MIFFEIVLSDVLSWILVRFYTLGVSIICVWSLLGEITYSNSDTPWIRHSVRGAMYSMILESCTVHKLILLENNWVGWWISTWRSDFLCYRPLLKLPFMIFYILREFVNSPSQINKRITLMLPLYLKSSLLLLRGLRNSNMWFVILPLDDYI